MPFGFETERLLLREWVVEDAEFLFTLNNDPEVIRYTGDDAFANVSAAEDFIRSYDQYVQYGHGRWLCIEKANGRPIGWCGLKNQGFIDLGYRFLRSEWGKGYATEAAFATLEQGFEHFDMNEIIGRVAEGNERSDRVLIKLGMEFTHVDRCHGLPARHYKLASDMWPEVKQAFLRTKARSKPLKG